MSYSVNWAPAYNDLNEIDSENRKRIIKKVGSIVDDPYHFVDRLSGLPYFKLRVGDYRIVIDVKDRELVIVLVGHRSKVYQELKRRN